MIIKALSQESGFSVTYDDGKVFSVPDAKGNRHYQELMEWVAEGNIIEPYVEPTPPPKTKFTPLEYLDRFTDTEEDAVIVAADQNVQIKKFYNRLLAATFVDLDDPRTTAGLNALVAAGILTEARKDEILTPEPQ